MKALKQLKAATEWLTSELHAVSKESVRCYPFFVAKENKTGTSKHLYSDPFKCFCLI